MGNYIPGPTARAGTQKDKQYQSIAKQVSSRDRFREGEDPAFPCLPEWEKMRKISEKGCYFSAGTYIYCWYPREEQFARFFFRRPA
jgi:hypothetical protein